MNMRNDIIERKEEILQWINEGQSKASMARELKCKPETLNRYLNLWNIEYDGNQSGKGTTKVSNNFVASYLKKVIKNINVNVVEILNGWANPFHLKFIIKMVTAIIIH